MYQKRGTEVVTQRQDSRLSQRSKINPLHSAQQKVKLAINRRARQARDRHRNPRLKVVFSDSPKISMLHILPSDHNVPAVSVWADILNEGGLEAALLYQHKDFRCNWFDNQAQLTDIHSTPVALTISTSTVPSRSRKASLRPVGISRRVTSKSAQCFHGIHRIWDRTIVNNSR